ncbi:MAG: hypothetical protein ACLR6B_14795 [Blautia sp.]
MKVLKTNDTWYGMNYHEDCCSGKGQLPEDAGAHTVFFENNI